MTIEDFNLLLQLQDKKEIETALKEAGYINAKISPEVRNANFYFILKASIYESPRYESEDKQSHIYGYICRNPRDYEGWEFIAFEICRNLRRGEACNGYIGLWAKRIEEE